MHPEEHQKIVDKREADRVITNIDTEVTPIKYKCHVCDIEYRFKQRLKVRLHICSQLKVSDFYDSFCCCRSILPLNMKVQKHHLNVNFAQKNSTSEKITIRIDVNSTRQNIEKFSIKKSLEKEFKVPINLMHIVHRTYTSDTFYKIECSK